MNDMAKMEVGERIYKGLQNGRRFEDICKELKVPEPIAMCMLGMYTKKMKGEKIF